MPTLVPLYVLAFCRVVVGVVFLLSSLSKARDRDRFQQTIQDFRLLSTSGSSVAATLFIGGELVVAAFVLIGGPVLMVGFLLALGLLVLFCLALGSALIRKISTSCNCFGANAKPISLLDIWRNTGLMFCALAGCLTFLWTLHSPSSLSLSEWILTGCGAVVFAIMWIQVAEIIHLFRQS